MSGWAYILLCADGSYYVGSTSYEEVNKRVDEHNDTRYIGYTMSRRPVSLVWSRHFDDLRDAHATERRIKGWSRAKKLALISGDESKLKKLAQRRAGKSAPQPIKLTKRQLASMAQEIGAQKGVDLMPARPKTAKARSGGSDMPTLKIAPSRHPEVRAGAKRRGAPKDD